LRFCDCVPFSVTLRRLTETEIRGYISKETRDCAGSFKIEGLGISLWRRWKESTIALYRAAADKPQFHAASGWNQSVAQQHRLVKGWQSRQLSKLMNSQKSRKVFLVIPAKAGIQSCK
jgi:hypothetical protein